MFARHVSLRTFVVAWILGVALALIPLASALAGGGGTFYPH
jgi:heme/copper-type cytochrome/quinol oxidase subunit 4